MIYQINYKEKKNLVTFKILIKNKILTCGVNKRKKRLFLKKVLTTFISKGLSKNLFYDEINCSNWNQLGCMPLVQAETLEQRKKESKVILIQKVIDGV